MQETSIDTISIKINSVADNASSGIETLCNKLQKLKTNLESVMETATKFSALKISSNISAGSDNKKAPYSDYGTKEQQYKQLGIVDAMENATLTKSIDTATDSWKQYKLENGDVVTVSEKTRDGLDGVKVSLQQLSSSTSTAQDAWNKFKGNLINGVTMANTVIKAFKNLPTTLTNMTKSIADAEESYNLFNVTLGENAKAANDWVMNVSDKLYLDPTNVRQYMGSFNSLIEGLGVGSDKAYLMSKNMTQLVYDLASFKNLDVATAFEKLQSGISGKIICLIRKGLRIVTNLIQ